MALNQQTGHPFQLLSSCNRCNKDESVLRVTLRPCHGCRDVAYCSQTCREADAESHGCTQTVSETKTFGRNCYILHSLSRDAEDTIETLSTLTKANTEKLLGKAINDQEIRKARAEEIISQAGSWNLNLKRLFAVKTGPFSEIPLRMLHSTTKSGSGDKKKSIDSFIAVSYRCPIPEWPDVKDFIDLRVEGKQIPISKQSWHFLLDVRESDQEGIWIDQICINQEDEAEKASAIAAMDALYASARLVFILLEDVTLTHDEFTILSEAFRKVSADRHWVFDVQSAHELFKKLFPKSSLRAGFHVPGAFMSIT